MPNSVNILNPYAIGYFVHLPRELRGVIWNKLPRNALGILQSCRQVREEALLCTQKSATREYHISPLYQENCWLSVNSRAANRKLPWREIADIKVEIRALDSNDPGQLVCLSEKIRNLVQYIGSIPDDAVVPSLTIHLRDTVTSGTALRCWTCPKLESSSLTSIPQNTLKGLNRVSTNLILKMIIKLS